MAAKETPTKDWKRMPRAIMMVSVVVAWRKRERKETGVSGGSSLLGWGDLEGVVVAVASMAVVGSSSEDLVEEEEEVGDLMKLRNSA
jgi:hypothetical protein